MKVIGKVTSGGDALKFLEGHTPDILITDLSMPGLSGIELVKCVKKAFPHILIIVLTMHNDRPTISEIIQAEADGYLLKNTRKKELLEAIRHIASHGTYYSKEVLSIVKDLYLKEKKSQRKSTEIQLTDRELEVLKLITEEKSSKEIADQLSISTRTVDSHRKNILAKTKARTLVGLVKFAFEHGLARLDQPRS